MDRLSFVFSLLLIVSVTATLGSVIKAKKPNGEELEELRSDPDPSAHPKVSVKSGVPQSGDVIPGHQLTAKFLKEFLNTLPTAAYQVAIGIDNESGHAWEDPTTYFASGTGKDNLPYYLQNDKAVLYGALSFEDSPYANGVLAYYIDDIDKTLAVMWVDPLVGNMWNIRLYDGHKEADSDMYSDLYNDNPIPNTAEFQNEDLGSGLKAFGIIANHDQTTLEIHVHKA